jgi:hypothetical protein
MGYDLKTIDDVRRRLKQAPGDLKVLIESDGYYYQIGEVKSKYVIHIEGWAGNKYQEVDEDTEGATQVMIIE